MAPDCCRRRALRASLPFEYDPRACINGVNINGVDAFQSLEI